MEKSETQRLFVLWHHPNGDETQTWTAHFYETDFERARAKVDKWKQAAEFTVDEIEFKEMSGGHQGWIGIATPEMEQMLRGF